MQRKAKSRALGPVAVLALWVLAGPAGGCGGSVPPPVAPGQVAIVSFAANPAFSNPSAPVTLSWQSQNALTCAISPTLGVIAPADLDAGQVSVAPTVTNRFTLTCQGAGGPVSLALFVAMIGFDTDGDLVDDTAEISYGSDPFVLDSDSDGLSDGQENRNGDTVVDAFETDATRFDTDGDGLSDGTEDANASGTLDPGETDPLDFDTDGDQIPDGTEDENGNRALDPGESNPLDIDTDDDSLLDGQEDADHDGTVDPGETDPGDPDTDGDGICDGIRADNDANGIDPADPCLNP